MRVRFLQLESGLRVRVAEAGPRDGPPVVLIHGWACSLYSFRFQIPPLAAAGFRVVTFDLKGHGLSDKPSAWQEYTPSAMRDYTAAVLDALDVGPAAFVGHSLGGGIATQLAWHQPARVTRLAVISAVGFGTIPLLRWLRWTPAPLVTWPARHLPLLTPRRLWHAVLDGVAGELRAYTQRDVDEYWAPTQFPGFTPALWHLLRLYRWSVLSAEERRALTMPLLAIFGRRDPLVRLPAAAYDASERRAAEVIVIEGAGHASLEEAPELVTAALLEFLAASSTT